MYHLCAIFYCIQIANARKYKTITLIVNGDKRIYKNPHQSPLTGCSGKSASVLLKFRFGVFMFSTLFISMAILAYVEIVATIECY